jgi:hypothetical protein
MRGDDGLHPSPLSQESFPASPAPTAAADRNLLFGMIALQIDFITREQLVAEFDA